MTDTAMNSQVGGNHYKELQLQPVQIAYMIGATPLWLKVCKYITRDKGSRDEDLKKAVHCIQLENELIELRCNKYIAELERFDHIDIKSFANQFDDKEFINSVLQDMYFGYYKTAAEQILEKMDSEAAHNTQYEG